ncbi:amidohydrolase family protein [Acidianus sulfidivorans JP7]|uniref:Amidohydrolase-related domain-containing protein n=1 Tax=Acidianus sulfidivorans JP7 TaxID=619593 RepID=A0A2U9ILF7_9CREN|nr:amidohydrolase family protein [Acidianus sulfidivorans]AWR96847.1 amidohydrolase family protein [Acidianus sulfidivorans JP7]
MIFKNAKVITSEGIIETDFEVEEGKIKKIKKEIIGEGKDLSGYYILPSVIDGHTHFNSRYLGAKEIIPTADDYKSGSEVSIAGGITSVVNFIDPLNRGVIEAVKEEIDRANSTAGFDYSFHLIVKKKEQIQQLPEVFKMGVKSVKMFMAYKGTMQVDDETMYLTMKKVKELGGTVAIHAENGDVIDALQQENKDKKEAIYHSITRPIEAEEEAVNRASMLAYLTGVKAYIVHISSPTSLDIVSYWRKKGANIYAETCPHYLLFDESYYERQDGNRFIMSPPLRKREVKEELVRKLNMVDLLGSDYSGYMSVYKDKALNYIEVPNGVSSTEFLVPTIMTFMFDGLITPENVAKITSENQIKIYNLKEKGFKEGNDADFAVIRREDWTVKDWHGKMDYSIYEGVKFKAKVVQSYLRGELVFDEDFKGSKGKIITR